MSLQKPVISLFLLFLFIIGYGLIVDPLLGLLDLQTENAKYLAIKGVMATLLCAYVVLRGLGRDVGLVARVNWHTLPLYWPMLLVLILIWLGVEELAAPAVLSQILLMTLFVGFAEELMFRGLVFHWFRHLSPVKLVLLSSAAFGGIHLSGLMSDIPSAVILAQSYFAFALGLIFGCARVRDYSILLPIGVHWLFDFFAIGARGGVSETFDGSTQIVMGLLFSGTIALLWGLYLLHKLRNKSKLESIVSVAML